MRRYLGLIALVALLLSSCGKRGSHPMETPPPLIPQPQSVAWGSQQYYTLSKGAKLVVPQGVEGAHFLSTINSALASAGLPLLDLADESDKEQGVELILEEGATDRPGGYLLDSSKEGGVKIKANSIQGLRAGVQTLRQLITKEGIATAEIEDFPRLPYRGFMLDVSRHYMSVEMIKRLLDEMELYKLNRFHWHLVDAGAWRLEIKHFPELTHKTAYRTESDWTKWWINKDRQYLDEGTPGAYGGYYTQEEAREIVAYAAERGITVIPEIEMPGHSEEVLYAYPHLSCSGKALPHESDFCIGNEATYTFLEGVLEEVMEIFPSEYIHIGGDEAGKQAWGTCPKCQALMRREGMKQIDELQSYLIHRIELFLNSKGRQIIGWDEILEGGLAPNATVMSWRGEEGGIAAAEAGHQVIMTPNSHLYLDFYQEDPTKAAREAIGGFTPLSKVYSYDPVPEALPEEASKYVVGVQANLWTEYVRDDEWAEYMIYPRLLALSEVAWTLPEHKEWQSFRERVNAHIPLLEARGVSPFTISYNLIVESEVDYDAEAFKLSMYAEKWPVEIRYRLDGEAPTLNDPIYTEGEVITAQDSVRLVVAIFQDGRLQGTPTTLDLDYHKGVGKKMTWQAPLHGGYPAGGVETALLDGYRGSITYLDGRWLGNISSDPTIGVIDLEEPTELTHIYTKCMHDTDPWVHMPEYVELSISMDGKEYTVVDRVYSKTDQADTRLRFETFHFYPNATAQYIKIEYHPAMEGKFLFTDEIVIW